MRKLCWAVLVLVCVFSRNSEASLAVHLKTIEVIEKQIEQLYAPYKFSATEPLSIEDLDLIFTDDDKKQLFSKRVTELRQALKNAKGTRCEKVLSDSFLRLALSQIDLYNLVELSSLRSDARSSVEEAVGCDPNNVRARRLLQKLR